MAEQIRRGRRSGGCQELDGDDPWRGRVLRRDPGCAECHRGGQDHSRHARWPGTALALLHRDAKGFLTAEDIDMELNFAPSGSSVIQELTGGSLDVAVSVGLTEPMQAIDKGAALALVRIIGKSAPYALVAKPTVKTIADLRGKTISIGAAHRHHLDLFRPHDGRRTGSRKAITTSSAPGLRRRAMPRSRPAWPTPRCCSRPSISTPMRRAFTPSVLPPIT